VTKPSIHGPLGNISDPKYRNCSKIKNLLKLVNLIVPLLECPGPFNQKYLFKNPNPKLNLHIMITKKLRNTSTLVPVSC
jgi:hypothetical protein